MRSVIAKSQKPVEEIIKYKVCYFEFEFGLEFDF